MKKENNQIKFPRIGQGIGQYQWNDDHIKIIQAGIDYGMNFIDTAEIYDKGRSEEIVGKAIKGKRNKVILGTKVSPEHLSTDQLTKAVEGSLKRLQTDHIDLYQIHWPNPDVPLEETVLAMTKMVKAGKIREIGVCNFNLRQLKEFEGILEVVTSQRLSSLQIEYNFFDRTIEEEILPYCIKNNIQIIAYSPLDKGRIGNTEKEKLLIRSLSAVYNKTPAQICLNFLRYGHSYIRRGCSNIMSIPKSTNMEHLIENAEVRYFNIRDKDIQLINEIFKSDVVKIKPCKIILKPKGQDGRQMYQTIDEALENKFNCVPSPLSLAEDVVKDESIKPVRLSKTICACGGCDDYHLREGMVRYWAWHIAHPGEPIPALIRENQ